MKTIFFNYIYSLVFVIGFLLLSLTYKEDILYSIGKPNIEYGLFPSDESFDLEECQDWTKNVRSFKNDKRFAEKIPVLMYHRVIAESNLNKEHHSDGNDLNHTIVTKSQFEKQMKFLKDENYTTLTTLELQHFIDGKISVPEKSVLLTFDDGFKDNYEIVYPILKKYNFKATNFLVTGWIKQNQENYDPEGHQYLSLEDLKNSCNTFDFQSHTYSFHQKTSNNKSYLISKNTAEIIEDLSKNQMNLPSKTAFAFPYGDYNDETITIIEKLGYKIAFTTEPADAEPYINKYEIPRKQIYPSDTIEDFKDKINAN